MIFLLSVFDINNCIEAYPADCKTYSHTFEISLKKHIGKYQSYNLGVESPFTFCTCYAVALCTK